MQQFHFEHYTQNEKEIFFHIYYSALPASETTLLGRRIPISINKIYVFVNVNYSHDRSTIKVQ